MITCENQDAAMLIGSTEQLVQKWVDQSYLTTTDANTLSIKEVEVGTWAFVLSEAGFKTKAAFAYARFLCETGLGLTLGDGLIEVNALTDMSWGEQL